MDKKCQEGDPLVHDNYGFYSTHSYLMLVLLLIGERSNEVDLTITYSNFNLVLNGQLLLLIKEEEKTLHLKIRSL